MSKPRKTVLAVIDALDPAALERAVAEDSAPALKALMQNGSYVDDCVSTFPSITPVAASAIATGLGPADHLVPSMNWYHRGEERYVEYGSSFAATRAFGIFRSLTDTVYNMNLAHLTQDHKTVHEHLDDAGFRTACTTYLIYRGRHRHEPSGDSPYRRLAEAAQFKHWTGSAMTTPTCSPMPSIRRPATTSGSPSPCATSATGRRWPPSSAGRTWRLTTNSDRWTAGGPGVTRSTRPSPTGPPASSRTKPKRPCSRPAYPPTPCCTPTRRPALSSSTSTTP